VESEEAILVWFAPALFLLGATLIVKGVSAGVPIGFAGIALVIFVRTSRIPRDFTGE